MLLDAEPVLHPVEIDTLRPTQMTVGYREVQRKRDEWKAQGFRKAGDYLGRHMIPVVLGPKDRPWMIDNHHLARALHEAGVQRVLVRVVADLRGLKGKPFRTFMDNRNWLHPFDAEGRRQPIADIPKHIADLTDDPYRSLAGALRRRGGYAKDVTPYSEFLWADFLRHHVSAHLVKHDMDGALEEALVLANGAEAAYLPGWAGVHDED